MAQSSSTDSSVSTATTRLHHECPWQLDWSNVTYPPITPFFARIDLELFDEILRGMRLLPAIAHGIAMVLAALKSSKALAPLFAEIARIMKPGGVFAFTVEKQKKGQEERYSINRVEVDEIPDDDKAVRLYGHSDGYSSSLLHKKNGFEVLKSLEFVAFKYPAEDKNIFFKAYITCKEN